MVFLITLFLCSELDPAFRSLRSFEVPEEAEYLREIHASCFGADGRLYALDPTQPRILVWDSDGRFRTGFGRKGQGPGELENPIQIAVHRDGLFVWQFDGRMTQFGPDGSYRESFVLPKAWPRRFAVASEDRFLINHRFIDERGKVFYHFDLRDREGEIFPVKRDRNPGFLDVKPGNNQAEIRAFMADVDIQRDGRGNLWYGYGYEKTLYRLGDDGKPHEKRRFELPGSRPTEDEIAAIQNTEVTNPDGTIVLLEDLPGLKIHYDVDKAFFTQFMIKGTRVVFVLTGNGGSDGVGDGDASASYVISDMNTGKALTRGSYKLPDGSQVHYRDGRITAFVVTEEGDYRVHEVTITGL